VIKKLLNPLIVCSLIFLIFFSMTIHLMYGSCQSSKWHYIIQNYYMEEQLPEWMLMNRMVYNSTGTKVIKIAVYEHYEGVWNEWYRNGNIKYSGTWKNKKTEGKHIAWYINEVKESVTAYNSGKPVSLIYWEENGEELQSWFKTYHKNGTKKEIKTMMDGNVSSIEEWDENGSIVSKKYFEYGGEFIKKEYFKNNVVFKTETEE